MGQFTAHAYHTFFVFVCASTCNPEKINLGFSFVWPVFFSFTLFLSFIFGRFLFMNFFLQICTIFSNSWLFSKLMNLFKFNELFRIRWTFTSLMNFFKNRWTSFHIWFFYFVNFYENSCTFFNLHFFSIVFLFYFLNNKAFLTSARKKKRLPRSGRASSIQANGPRPTRVHAWAPGKWSGTEGANEEVSLSTIGSNHLQLVMSS